MRFIVMGFYCNLSDSHEYQFSLVYSERQRQLGSHALKLCTTLSNGNEAASRNPLYRWVKAYIFPISELWELARELGIGARLILHNFTWPHGKAEPKVHQEATLRMKMVWYLHYLQLWIKSMHSWKNTDLQNKFVWLLTLFSNTTISPFKSVSGLSLRGGGEGFSSATMNVALATFIGKQKKNSTKRNPLL